MINYRFLLFLSIIVASYIYPSSASALPFPSQLVNVAHEFGTIVGSSGAETGNPEKNLIDGIKGNDNNRWSVPGLLSKDLFAEIDLGANFRVEAFRLDTFQNRAYQFYIEAKPENGTYARVGDLNASTQAGPIEYVLPVPIISRHIRITVTGASGYTGDWMSLREFEVYGSPTIKNGARNVAHEFGAIVGSSGSETGNPEKNLIDGIKGNDNNRWSVPGLISKDLFAEIDLGANFKVDAFSLDTYQNRAYQFYIEARSESGTYSRIVDRNANTQPGPIEYALPASIISRYIRITITGASGYTGDWVSLREFEVYGSPIIENVAQKFGIINGSSGAQTGNPERNLIDGIMSNDNNRWSVAGLKSGNWVEIDLKRNYDLDSITLDTYQNRAYQFKIDVKPDGGNYSTKLDMSANAQAGPITASFSGKPRARFVKLTVTGANSYTGDWISLRESQLFGSLSANVPTDSSSSTGSSSSTIPASTGSSSSTPSGSSTNSSSSTAPDPSTGPGSSTGSNLPTGSDPSAGSGTYSFLHPGGLNTIQQIYTAAQKIKNGEQPWSSAWSQLQSFANARLNEQPSAPVTYGPIPAFYQNKSGNIAAKAIMQNDMFAAYSCAAFYAVNVARTGVNPSNDQYANKAVQILNNWASVNKDIVVDEQTSLDVSNAGPGLVGAAELIWNYPGWASDDRTKFVSWVKNELQPAADFKKLRSLMKTPQGTYEVPSYITNPYYSNHNAWGILLSIAIDHFIENRVALDADVVLLKKLIDLMVKADGSMPEEIKRGSNGIVYTAFALEPLAASVEIVRNAGGQNLYNWTAPGGGSLRKALDFLYNKGIENPSLWPISGTQSAPPHAPELFAAMGPIYGVSKWTNWAKPQIPDLETGVGFPLPTLFRSLPFNAQQSILTVGTPTNLHIQ